MRIRTRTLALAAVGALVLAMGTLPAGSDEHDDAAPTVASVTGSATGGYFQYFSFDDEDGQIAASVGPAPEVILPPEGGGPFTDSLAGLVLEFEDDTEPVSGPLEVSTDGALGADGYAASSVSIEDLSDYAAWVATALDVECSSDLVNGPTASTTITNGESIEGPLPTNPEPNTVVIDEVFEDEDEGFVEIVTYRVVLNQQFVEGDTIYVTGITSFFSVEYVEVGGPTIEFVEIQSDFGMASCGATEMPEPVPAPTTPPVAAPAQVTPRFTG